MKKIILLLSIAILSFSCSDDDDDSGNNPDLFGTWKLIEVTYDGEEEILDECVLQNTLIFTSSSLEVSALYFNEESQECDDDGSESDSYSSTSNTITYDGDTVNYTIDGDILTIIIDGDLDIEVYEKQ